MTRKIAATIGITVPSGNSGTITVPVISIKLSFESPPIINREWVSLSICSKGS